MSHRTRITRPLSTDFFGVLCLTLLLSMLFASWGALAPSHESTKTVASSEVRPNLADGHEHGHRDWSSFLGRHGRNDDPDLDPSRPSGPRHHPDSAVA